MKNKFLENFSNEEFRKSLHLAEYEFFDGDDFVTMNIVDINTDTKKVTIATTNRGKISVSDYDLMQTLGKMQFYFEYGNYIPETIFINDFTITKGVYAI